MAKKKYYSVVLSVIDKHGNRVDTHEITSCPRESDATRWRDQLAIEIAQGRFDQFICAECALSADIEVHDDETWELLEII